MNRKLIIRILGAILCIEAIFMIPSLLLSIYYHDGATRAMGICILVLALPGAGMFFHIRTEKGTNLRLKEGFVVVALGWVFLSICGALPFFLSGALPNFMDALFESVSGFTTTGASVLNDFDSFPRGVLFWRATTHWIGGMGVLVLTLALLPKLTGRTAHLVKAESPGPSLSKLVPKTGQTAKILYRLYIGLTLAEFTALLCCGLSPYDAAYHSLATAGTGGFSNYGGSVAAFQNLPAEIVITLFMFLFGVNFALYYKFLIGDYLKAFYGDEEFRWYLGITFSLILLTSLFNLSCYSDFWTSLRYSSFTVCSMLSTTGFVLTDYTRWPVSSQMLILFGMYIGSCAGSTAGGMKVIRANLLFKLSRRTVRAASQPKKVEVVRLDGKAVEESMLSQIAIFGVMYFALVLIGGVLLALDNRFDPITHFTASLTCVSNVGPAFGAVNPMGNFSGYSVWGKFVCSLLMLFGRLELLPVFILFTRSAWHKS